MIRFTFIAVVALAIAGCSPLGSVSSTSPTTEIWKNQQQQLAAFEQWDLRARSVLRLEGQAYNIGIRWQRQATGLSLVLEAPFGQGVFQITQLGDARYQLLLPDGQLFEHESVEALLEQATGWSLPISGLDYWIRGMPRPDEPYSFSAGKDGRTQSLKQDQWEINYLDFFDDPELPLLPRKIELAGKTIVLRLVIERWLTVEIDDDPGELFPEFN